MILKILVTWLWAGWTLALGLHTFGFWERGGEHD